MRLGSKGDQVRRLQQLLSEWGFETVVDGDFGPDTMSSVVAFQSSVGISRDGVAGRVTRDWLMAPNVDPSLAASEVLRRASEIGHLTDFADGRLWLFGIRSRSRKAGDFDDILGCIWKAEGRTHIRTWQGTTDPGKHYLLAPQRAEGTAILAEGQYVDAWRIDFHRGQYEALCQRSGEVAVYRDATGDDRLDLDPSTIVHGYFGINIHASTQVEGRSSSVVGRWSAGCVVHATERGFTQMMTLARRQVWRTRRETFTFTLLNEWR